MNIWKRWRMMARDRAWRVWRRKKALDNTMVLPLGFTKRSSFTSKLKTSDE
jgi:hypothetical protein